MKRISKDWIKIRRDRFLDESAISQSLSFRIILEVLFVEGIIKECVNFITMITVYY